LRVLLLARDSTAYMISARYAIARPSTVRPSVCHTGGSVKNGWSMGLRNFHRTRRTV